MISLFYQTSYAGNAYTISEYSVANGGGKSTSGNYKINGSIAQVVTAKSIGGDYTINSGFWHTPSTSQELIFKNSFEQ